MRDAFAARDAAACAIERQALARSRGGTLWSDPTDALGLTEVRKETRRDEPLSRARWQFGLRDEIVADWPAA